MPTFTFLLFAFALLLHSGIAHGGGKSWFETIDPAQTSLLKQNTLQNIEEQIGIIDEWIPGLESIDLMEDVTSLEESRASLLEHRGRIGEATDPRSIQAAVHAYGSVYPDLSSEIGRIRAKVELPEKFNTLFLALQEWSKAPDVFWRENNLGVFHEGVSALNTVLQEMPAGERADKGLKLIAEFVEENDPYFLILFPGNKKFEPPKENIYYQRASGAAAAVGMGAPPLGVERIKPPSIEELDPSKRVIKPKPPLIRNALVIIVDDWLKNDDYFKAQTAVTIQGPPPLETRVRGVLDDVTAVYKEMSYEQEWWNFDICEVKDPNVPPQDLSLSNRMVTAIRACLQEYPNRYAPSLFSDYEAIILWPHPITHATLGDIIIYPQTPKCGLWVSTAPRFGTEAIGNPTFKLGQFNKYLISYGLAHCLRLYRAAAYDCGNNVYGPGCVDTITDSGMNALIGDFYDLMGIDGIDFGNYVNSPLPKFPHLGCIHKEMLGWVKPVPAKIGQPNNISAIEQNRSARYPRCLTLPVDRNLVQAGAPCDALYLEYRTPRVFLGAMLGGLALHCKTPADIVGGREEDFWSFSKLLDCRPNSQPDPLNDDVDGFTFSGGTCTTGLGYTIGFDLLSVDEGKVTIEYSPCLDRDSDSFQDPKSFANCKFETAEDCDDGNVNIHPGAQEVCNNKDDNCDGQADEGLKQLYYLDFDQDGYGDKSAQPKETCQAPAGYVVNNWDCDDTDFFINPNGKERCSHKDYDCNGVIGGINYSYEYCPTCIETDGGDNPAVGGTATVIWGPPSQPLRVDLPRQDTCQQNNVLLELFCIPHPVYGSYVGVLNEGSRLVPCPSGMVCAQDKVQSQLLGVWVDACQPPPTP